MTVFFAEIHKKICKQIYNFLDSNKGYATQPRQPSGLTKPYELETFVPPTSPIPAKYGNASVDPEHLSEVKGFDFSDQSIRKGFIRKVCGILSVSIF